MDSIKRLWQSHRTNILTGGLGYPFPQVVLEKLVDIFMDVVKRSVFLDISGEVINLKVQIDRGKISAAGPLPLILALTLSSNRKSNAVQEEIIKIIAVDQ